MAKDIWFILVDGLEDWPHPVVVASWVGRETVAGILRDSLQKEFREELPSLKFSYVTPADEAETIALFAKQKGTEEGEFGEQVKAVYRAGERQWHIVTGWEKGSTTSVDVPMADAPQQSAQPKTQPESSGLFDRLEDELTPQGFKIVSYLWDKKNGSGFDALTNIPRAFRAGATDEAIAKALKRIGEYLNLNLDLGLSIQIDSTKRRAKLTRSLDKPGDKIGDK